MIELSSTTYSDLLFQFSKNISKSKLVIIDFYADWCGPCKLLKSAIEQIEKNKSFDISDVGFYQINCDDNKDIAIKNGIRSIPCLVVYKDGKELVRRNGGMTAKDLSTWSSELLLKI